MEEPNSSKKGSKPRPRRRVFPDLSKDGIRPFVDCIYGSIGSWAAQPRLQKLQEKKDYWEGYEQPDMTWRMLEIQVRGYGI